MLVKWWCQAAAWWAKWGAIVIGLAGCLALLVIWSVLVMTVQFAKG